MIKTFKEIRNFNVATDEFINAKPKNFETKLGYALKRVASVSVQKAIKEYQSAYHEAYYTDVQTAHIDNALTDKVTGAVLTSVKGSDRPYLYDKVGLKNVMEAEKKWNEVTSLALLEEWDKKEFEVVTYFATEIPCDLSDDLKEAFMGFVINPEGETPVEEKLAEPIGEKGEEVIS